MMLVSYGFSGVTCDTDSYGSQATGAWIGAAADAPAADAPAATLEAATGAWMAAAADAPAATSEAATGA
jgi:hypothetical protein